MAKSAILTPFNLSSNTEKVGRRRFWKQVLPVTSINYEGRKVDFDPDFHMDLAQSFKKGAFDQVPLVFADARNGHNMDPRNYGGDIVDMEYRGPGKDQGTWALIEADKQAAKVIERNPKLGVSARIRQAIEKADGRFFKRGIEHVLLTMNPRVTGMSPWQAVDLSEDADIEVVDLTAAEYTEGTKMGKTATKGRRQSQPKIDLSALDEDEFKDLLLDMTAQVAERGVDLDDLEAEVDDEDDEDEEETPAPPRRRKSKVKVTKTTERDSEVDPEDDEEDEDDEDDTDLSERVIRRDEVSQFGQMRIDLAKRDWKTKRGQYLAAGVPPVLLDLAEPVLVQPDEMVIDLADADGKEKAVDFREILTDLLDNVSHIVDLSGEIGHGIDLAVDDDEASEAEALLEVWDKEYSA